MNLNRTHINNVIRDITTLDDEVMTDSKYNYSVRFAAKYLLEATPFLIGEASKLIKMFKFKDNIVHIFRNEADEDIKLPFPVCWFEFHFEVDDPKKFSYNGALLLEQDDVLFIQPINYNDVLKRWIVTPMSIIVSFSKPLSETKIGKEALIPREYLESFTGNVVPILNSEYRSDELLRRCVDHELSNLGIINLILLLLNSQNISLIKKSIPLYISETRIKKGKLKRNKFKNPISDYYVLKIKVLEPSNKKQTTFKEYSLEDIGSGHFRIYTKEKPLFGKYTGRWWWNKKD